ncbi:cathepsin B-like cysteine proteinase 3 isoform X1 [Oscarella lobularis]|uniref:cathepsin B-like cysteine proteinase 3 isoform X1 n=1 Tax=Oscarella lobularis TaxID=121494 RepID=UPI003313C891
MTIGEARRMAGFAPDERLSDDLASNYTRPRPNREEANFSGLKQYPPIYIPSMHHTCKWGNIIHPIRDYVRIEIPKKPTISALVYEGNVQLLLGVYRNRCFFSDRLAISNNAQFPRLSPQQLVSCDTNQVNYGQCQPGNPLTAIQIYMMQAGNRIVLSLRKRKWGYAPMPQRSKLPKSCKPSFSFLQNFRLCSTLYTANDVLYELYSRGPIISGFVIPKRSVPRHVSGASLNEKHALRILGWGVENGEDYCIAMRKHMGKQLGTTTRYFKIRRGTNECGIERNFMTVIL